jgi:hypothetical protein
LKHMMNRKYGIIENGLNEIKNGIINIWEQNERQNSLLKEIISKNGEQTNNDSTMFEELCNSIIANNNETRMICWMVCKWRQVMDN